MQTDKFFWIGYGQHDDSFGETHIYDPMMYNKDQARQEMMQIVQRLMRIPEHEEISDDSPISIDEDSHSFHEDIDRLIMEEDHNTQEDRRAIGY